MKLKPCPFCGSEAKIVKDCVCCTKPMCALNTYNQYYWENETKQWNTRPIENAQAEQITIYKEALEKLANRGIGDFCDCDIYAKRALAANPQKGE